MKIAFLDRDGVINNEVNYLHKISDFKYTYKCIDALKNIIAKGYKIIIVTNQAGIAKGIFKMQDYKRLTEFYLNDLAKKNITILDILFCPHHPEGIVDEFSYSCDCRKPEPGMFLKAMSKYDISLEDSFMVGDKISDIEAAEKSGINNLFLVNSGHKISSPTNIPKYENLYEISNIL